MLPFHWLRVPCAGMMDFRPQMARLRSPIIRVKAPDSKWLQPCLQLQNYLICTPAKDMRSDRAGPVIDGLPEPPWLRLLAHRAPQLLDFCVVNV